MNYIFIALISVSIILSFINNTTEALTTSMLEGCNLAIKVSFSLIGIMAFWLGIMRVAEKAGFITLISNVIKPLIRPLFKDLPKDSNAFGDISMSLSANALGLTNAATPIGLKVMEKLQQNNQDKEIASDSMCMFLAMNTAGFQIIPATVIAILVGLGAKNPTEIILPTLIVTTITFFISIIIALTLKNLWKKSEGKKC